MIRIILLFSLLTFADANAHNCSKTRCESIKQQIRKIESKMRSGYSAAQGIRLDAKLRELREKRQKACR